MFYKLFFILQIIEKHGFHKIKSVRWDVNTINRFEIGADLRDKQKFKMSYKEKITILK